MDLIHFEGPAFVWTGGVVSTSQSYLILMDTYGYLCRVPKIDDGLQGPVDGPDGMLGSISLLFERPGVKEAIDAASQSDPDDAGYDLWRFALADLTHGERPLRPLLKRYYSWGAYQRRKFEQAVNTMVCRPDRAAGEVRRQAQVFVETVLGPWELTEFALREGLQRDNARVSQWRARQFLAQCVGEALLSSA